MPVAFLKQITSDVVSAARIPPGQTLTGYGPGSPNLRQGEGGWPVHAYGPNNTGGPLYRPGGRACYPALWIRDYAMSLSSGLIPADEQRHALHLTARSQPLEDWTTPSGSLVPRGAIPDHITLAGKPVFFPGTVDDYERQGGIWGARPPLDDQFFFIEMGWHLAIARRRKSILAEQVEGVRLLERLDLAFSVPKAHAETGLIWCDDSNRGASFGFMDTVIHTGELLFCSLLRYRAARQMAQLHQVTGELLASRTYWQVAENIAAHLGQTFSHASGLLRASTGKSAQPDVWGSAFAIYCGALPSHEALPVCYALLDAYRRGTIACCGNIRQVPTDADFDCTTAWELTIGPCAKNRYQNGAYWGTATGWVAYAIAQVDEMAARKLASEYIAELQVGDYRRGEGFGSPFECFHPDGNYVQNPVYMTSVTCPLAAFRRLRWS